MIEIKEERESLEAKWNVTHRQLLQEKNDIKFIVNNKQMMLLHMEQQV
jgi:hypothetical protein